MLLMGECHVVQHLVEFVEERDVARINVNGSKGKSLALNPVATWDTVEEHRAQTRHCE